MEHLTSEAPSTPDHQVCSRCGAIIGPGEYKLPLHVAPPTVGDRTIEERTAWMCRGCTARYFVACDEDGDE
jgi:hypothetical protein